MKLSEFKAGFKLRMMLLSANLKYSLDKELAYPASNWGNLFSSLFFLVSHLILINVIFSNVKAVAGYSKNEMLVFFMLSEIAFIFNWVITRTNLINMIQAVNRGDFDLVLIKPVPTLFYISFRELNLITTIRDSMPVAVVLFAIDWQGLHFDPVNSLLAAGIFILGLYCLYVWHLAAALPVFWLGESQGILDLAGQLGPNASILVPLEGYPMLLRSVLTTIIPVLICSGLATSVLLGKSTGVSIFLLIIAVSFIAVLIKNYIWNKAIASYTSASS